MEYTENTAVGCVIMASGRAVRFGSNKLLADFGGAPLIVRALDVTETPALAARVVVTRSPEVAELACKAGVKTILHSLPGRNDTVRLGLDALLGECPGLGGCIFLPGDQPLLRRESVRAEVEFFRRHPDRIVAMGHGGVRGNPCIFPARFFPELTALEGDHGGSAVIRRHEDALALFEVSPDELRDVDTPMALAALRDTLA